MIKPTEYAFPKTKSATFSSQNGMTLRDYFAAKALQGIVATMSNEWVWNNMQEAADDRRVSTDEHVARASYEYADAMLKAREVKK